jgi:short-subunit dehydrogenase involved in D-alanine esterification of teichoic acids
MSSEVSLVRLFYPLVLAKKSVDRSNRIITGRDMSVLKDFVQLIPKLIATHYDFDGNQNTPS